MSVKNKVTVKIMKQEYTLISEDSREHMQRVSNLVDDKMAILYKNNKKIPQLTLSVLTAINMADEYVKLLDSTENLDDEAISNIMIDKLKSKIKELEATIVKKDEKINELDELLIASRKELEEYIETFDS